jgi:site-specific recombinase
MNVVADRRARRRGPAVEAVRASLRGALDALAKADPKARQDALVGLIDVLRPPRRGDVESASQRLESLTSLLTTDDARRGVLREAVAGVMASTQWVHLFADAGVLSGEGFFTGLWRRVAHAILPDVYNSESLRDYLGRLFSRSGDHRWVDGIPDECWASLVDVLDLDELAETTRARVAHQVLESVQVLSYRIAAMGLEPELVRNYPAIEHYESPFLAQSEEVRELIRERREALAEKRAPAVDEKHLLVLFDQCLEIVGKVRREAEKSGASISLTALILRLQESIARVQALLRLLEQSPENESDMRRVKMFKELIRAVNTEANISVHWSRHMELLALRVTGNAGRTGERYITSTAGEYRHMFRSAAGAGFVIAFLALNKVAFMATPNAPIVEAALYSLNYGLGFVLIYVLHFTIATKQPAMTASYIAASMGNGARANRLDGLAELVVRTVRSQFIAVVGNVSVVLPMSVLLALAYWSVTGVDFVDPARAGYLLHDLSPFNSPALFHAAIAGVCLFLSGLISGYYDNRAVYNELRLRITQRPLLRRWLGDARTDELGRYVEDHLGGIAGNFAFGVMLGSMGSIGFVFGLPIDIRHITFSTAYLGVGVLGLDGQITLSTLAVSVLGVVAIGIVNLAVSFSLALWVAMRSQRVRFVETPDLLRRLISRFRREPLSYFVPPREAPAEAA